MGPKNCVCYIEVSGINCLLYTGFIRMDLTVVLSILAKSVCYIALSLMKGALYIEFPL